MTSERLAERALYTLSIEVADVGFDADYDGRRVEDERGIERVLPYVADWVRERVGDRSVPPELVNRLIAEALLAQWVYDFDLMITQAEPDGPVEGIAESSASPI
jgi:hypothetical protein